MLKAFLLFTKIALMAGLVVIIAGQQGSIIINWQEYRIQADLGLFLAAVFVAFIMIMMCVHFLDALLHIPTKLKDRKKSRRKDKGYKSLTRGMAAVAAGNAKAADKYAIKTENYLPHDKGLPLLLKAQAAQLNNRHDEAKTCFETLMSHPDGGFLGVRGLLAQPHDMNANDVIKIASHALKSRPKHPWLLQTIYDVSARKGDWDSALKFLKTMEKSSIVTQEHADRDRAALWLLKGRALMDEGLNLHALKALKRALQYNAAFAPAVHDYVEIALRENKKRSARAVIKTAWKIRPHPDFISLYLDVMPMAKHDAGLARMNWLQTLIDLRPGHTLGYRACAHEAAAQHLWGEARRFMSEAEVYGADTDLYDEWIMIERRSNMADAEEMIAALQAKRKKAASAPSWVCNETGRIFSFWQPFSGDKQPFNTIVFRAQGGSDITV